MTVGLVATPPQVPRAAEALISRTERGVIERAVGVARQVVEQGLDLRVGLGQLAAVGAMGMRASAADGGCSESTSGYLALNDALSEISAPLAFLVQQHNGVVGLLSRNAEAKAWLPKLAAGQVTVAPAASHLRRSGGGESLVATPNRDGSWVVSGSSPYVSGYRVFSHVLLAARVDQEASRFFLVPFREEAGLQITAPHEIWTCRETSTVAIRCDELVLQGSAEVGCDQANYFAESHPGMLAQAAAFSLGLTRRILAELRAHAGHAAFAVDTCESALGSLAETFYSLASLAPAERGASELAALAQVRVQASQLAASTAIALMAAMGGRGQAVDHPSNHLLRDVTFFMVTTINDAVKAELVAAFLAQGASVGTASGALSPMSDSDS